VLIDVRLDQVILGAMQQNIELRYQQASDVKTVLETIATTPPQTAANASNFDAPHFDALRAEKPKHSKPMAGPSLSSTTPPATDWLLWLFSRGVYAVAAMIALLPIFVLGIDPLDPIDSHIARFVGCPIVALIVAAGGKLLTLVLQFLLMRLHGTPPIAARPAPSLAKIALSAAFYVLVAYFAGLFANRVFSLGPAGYVDVKSLGQPAMRLRPGSFGPGL
ncbi:MAG TPA: hypothetical protein VGG30_01665, partial [Pirellulales bacterium]|jgi:hypothetical protein